MSDRDSGEPENIIQKCKTLQIIAISLHAPNVAAAAAAAAPVKREKMVNYKMIQLNFTENHFFFLSFFSLLTIL